MKNIKNEKHQQLIFNLADNVAILIQGGMSIENIKKDALPDLNEEAKEIIIKMAINKNEALNNSGKIFRGKYTTPLDQVATFENGRIFRGKYTSSRDQVGLIEGNRIYSGTHVAFGCEPVGTIVGNKIYRGKCTWPGDVVATIEGNKIYRAKHTSSVRWDYEQIANVEGGGAKAAAAAAFLLLL